MLLAVAGGVVLVLLGLVVGGFLGVLVALPSAAWCRRRQGRHLGATPGPAGTTPPPPTNAPESSAEERLSSG
jgi:hypothetical protein